MGSVIVAGNRLFVGRIVAGVLMLVSAAVYCRPPGWHQTQIDVTARDAHDRYPQDLSGQVEVCWRSVKDFSLDEVLAMIPLTQLQDRAFLLALLDRGEKSVRRKAFQRLCELGYVPNLNGILNRSGDPEVSVRDTSDLVAYVRSLPRVGHWGKGAALLLLDVLSRHGNSSVRHAVGDVFETVRRLPDHVAVEVIGGTDSKPSHRVAHELSDRLAQMQTLPGAGVEVPSRVVVHREGNVLSMAAFFKRGDRQLRVDGIQDLPLTAEALLPRLSRMLSWNWTNISALMKPPLSCPFADIKQ